MKKESGMKLNTCYFLRNIFSQKTTNLTKLLYVVKGKNTSQTKIENKNFNGFVKNWISDKKVDKTNFKKILRIF